jgi:hypothetical protein
VEIGNLKVYGIIYKITNLVNSKVYIGQTAREFNKRYFYLGNSKLERVYNTNKSIKEKNNGYYNSHLLESMDKYGLTNFKLDEVFDIAFSKEELDIKEICWISYYDSYKNGYNNVLGGDGNYGAIRISGESNPCSKKVLQFSLDGQFIRKWGCINDVTRELNISASDISNVCTKNKSKNGYCRKSAGGYLWKFEEDYNTNRIISYDNKVGEYNKQPVIQLSLQGKFIKEYNSISEAVNSVKGTTSAKISSVCKGKRKSHKNFIWIYKENFNENKIYNYNPKNYGKEIEIVQLDKKNNIIKKFKSMSEASKELNLLISKISQCCTGKRKTYGGFKWMYYKEYFTYL